MFIKKIKISDFGKLSNLDITPSSHLNLIYGCNGSGKSTFLSFIKYIFYGTKHKKALKDLTFKERYTSWETMSMDGSCYIYDGSENYLIKRSDNPNASLLSVVNPDTGYDYKNISKPGETFIGINGNIFNDTFFINNIPTVISSSDKSEIISFLSESYDCTNTYSNIKTAITENILNIQSTKRKDSVISVINKDINLLKEKLHRLESDYNNISARKSEIDNLENLIDKTNEEISKFTRISNVIKINNLKNDLKNLQEEKEVIENKLLYRDDYKLSDEEAKLLVDDFDTLKSQIDFAKKNNIKHLLLFILSLTFSASSYIADFFKIGTFLFLLMFCLSVIFFAKYFIGKKKLSNTVSDFELLKLKQSKLRKELNLCDLSECLIYISSYNNTLPLNNINYLEKRLGIINNEIDAINKELFESRDSNHDLDDIDINSFTNCNLDDIIDDNKRVLMEYKDRLSKISHYKNDLIILCNEIKSVKNELDLLYRKKEDAEYEASLYMCSLDILENAFLNIKESLIPEILETSNKIFNDIFKSDYELINLADNFEFTVKIDDNYKSSKYLSTGTCDALYFSLRIAIINVLTKEKSCPPIFIDDIFANMDDARTENMLNIIYKLSEKYQIFVCTCRKRELEFFENKRNVNIINL